MRGLDTMYSFALRLWVSLLLGSWALDPLNYPLIYHKYPLLRTMGALFKGRWGFRFRGNPKPYTLNPESPVAH